MRGVSPQSIGRIVVADSASGLASRSQLNAFVSVPSSEMAENVLQQRGMVYERNCKNLYVYGNDSDFFASFLDTDARRPMHSGLLNPKEEMSQHMIQRIIELLVPRARKGDTLCFSVPGKGEGVNGGLVYHEAVLKSFLQSLGYKAKPVNEGQAVATGQPIVQVVTGRNWITANFKETQIGHMRAGQPVEFTVDAYSGTTFKGAVESICEKGTTFTITLPGNT